MPYPKPPRRLRSGEHYYLTPVLLDGGDVVHILAIAGSEARAARVITSHNPQARLLALPRPCQLAKVRHLHTLHSVVAESTPS